jgi:adenosine deaminase
VVRVTPLPSVLLHDHLDGGLRPRTVLELAESGGYHGLPVGDVDRLADWFDQGPSGSLERYLGAFEHTIAVMQSPEALSRVAEEALVDLAADGVVYTEQRFAPLLHTRRGLTPVAVIDAVIAGMARGAAATGVGWGIIVDAIRSEPDSFLAAEAAAERAGAGVVGFDLAGPEREFPPHEHLAAIGIAREAGLRITLHAGEAAGPASIASAVLRCATERIGHGVEVIEDCVVDDGRIVELGAVASTVRDRRIPLELCPTSNLHTKHWTADRHPIGMLYRAGFAVTINTDNRLMSRTSMSDEFDLVRTHHGFTVDDLATVTRTALDAAFCSHPERRRLWEDRIAPAYRAAGAELTPLFL